MAGVFVDARYRILLSEEQVELAKAGLLEVAFKARHCSVRAFNVSDTADTSSESILVGDITSTDNPVSSASEEDEFEKELDLLERKKSPEHLSSSNTFNQVAQEMNNYIEKMVCARRLKAENVWKIIASLDEPLQTTAKILSAMPVTQVSVERLFSSMKFILSDQR